MKKNKLLSIIIRRFSITFSSLKHTNYRYFWLGQCISVTGTWMQRTAQVWLVYTLSDSALVLGLMGFFQFMPMLVFSLLVGVFVDRFSKKKIIYYTQAGFMLQSITLALLVWSGKVEWWHVLVSAAVFGCLQTVDGPARQSWYVHLVGIEDLPNAISLNSTVMQMAKFIGPMLAGIVIAKFGIMFCFLISGVSKIAVFFALFFISEQGAPRQNTPKNVMTDIREGIRHVHGNIYIRITILIVAIFCTFAMNSSIIIPVFSDTILSRGVDAYTALLSATGIGALIGAISMANRSQAVRCKQLILDAIITSIVLIAAGFMNNYYLAFVLMVILGIFNIRFLNMANSILQINTGNAYRGRVMSIFTLVNQGAHPLGNVFSGTIMQFLGADIAFITCGTTLLCLLGILFLSVPMKEYCMSSSQTVKSSSGE